jgi:hypothetical protein
MTFFGCISSLRAQHESVAREAHAFMKHALSVHFASRMRAFARLPTTLQATFSAHEKRVLTLALRRACAPSNGKHLKKRHFSITPHEKRLAKARACAIFRADSLYAATVAPRFSHSQNFFEE